MFRSASGAGLVVLTFVSVASAAQVTIEGLGFKIPDGFQLQRVAEPPLVDRPITAAFDDFGRLYVAESSGSNDPVEQQLQERPHRILRLEDVDGDGVFDRRTVFADRMMFPEGTLWLDGSLYVAAPPSIWKLTDLNDDGVCDRREEWFNGKTLTHCANDLHGPYVGPDGWIYWCKGAFAEQTYERPGREPLATRAAHIFRRRPEGGPIEAVMTGGMDNPVDVVFSRSGEPFFTSTFVQHPAGGRRDALVHAIYGGVYGKRHGVIESHPRTGPLMPAMTHLGAAAPSGLELLKSDQLGFRDDLVAALFNMRKVTRHELIRTGSTFTTRDADLVVCDRIDFHPTDVIEDADGSLLIVDTGGWYKLCCPTSQLWKPDVLGGIYRLKKLGAHRAPNPRGLTLPWDMLSAVQLTELLADQRFQVRRRAENQLAGMGERAVGKLAHVSRSPSSAVRVSVAWVLGRIGSPSALDAVRAMLLDPDEQVRQAAIHVVSLHRDRKSLDQLLATLADGSPANRRAAAAALGRIGDPRSVSRLLASGDNAEDRAVEHALTYALIEIDEPSATRRGLSSPSSGVQRIALTALDQMESSDIAPADVVPRLESRDRKLRQRAAWIAARRRQWHSPLAEYLAVGLRQPIADGKLAELQPVINSVAAAEGGYAVLGALTTDVDTSPAVKNAVLRAVRDSPLETLPQPWNDVLVAMLSSKNEELLDMALEILRQRSPATLSSEAEDRLAQLASQRSAPSRRRLAALAVLTKDGRRLQPEAFDCVLLALRTDRPEPERSLAADILGRCDLDSEQCGKLVAAVVEVGPLEIDRVVAALAQCDEVVALATLQVLAGAEAAGSLSEQRLSEVFSQYGPVVRRRLDQTVEQLARRRQQQRQALIELAENLPPGDARRGQVVFNSTQTSCSACHRLGYLGGDIGPDLTRIGQTRSRQDLLEAILLPSASFVRSYEPVLIVTVDGRSHTGLVRDQTSSEVLLVDSNRKQLRFPRDEIQEMAPSPVSIMPAGLEQQLTRQQLADLIELLLTAN